MPNWCHNSLVVEGSPDQISKFKKKAEGATQNYNYFDTENTWPAFENVRIKAIWESLPKPGRVEVFSFHALCPVPDDVMRLPYDDNQARKICQILGIPSETSGYSWEVENWGVKWGACNPFLDSEGDGQLIYEFDTPWGPPTEFLRKVSQDWPELVFELSFQEPGAGFCGEVTLINGEGDVQEREMEFSEEEEEES